MADEPKKDADPKKDAEPKKEEARERPERTVTVDREGPFGRYRVTASTVNLKGPDGKDRASIFSVAYTLASQRPEERPVTFCFNGGPGSSSVWLQFGAFGPVRVDLPDLETAHPSPPAVIDNPHSLLDVTDLVFIDPVGTGFSRAAGTAKDEEFHGVDEDLKSVSEFIWRWLSKNQRWHSPKLLAGESYGTTRAAGLAHDLHERGVSLNGLVLVSVALDFGTFISESGNDLPHVLYLPSLAAVAAYHGRVKVQGDLDDWLRDVRYFAVEEYAPALLLGARLEPSRRAALAARLSALTGLPAEAISRRHLRIPYLWFARTLLGDGERTVGRLDARYVGPDSDPHGTTMNRDPSYDAAKHAFTAAANDFLRRGLGWDSDESYDVLSMPVNERWRFHREPKRFGYPSTTDELRKALLANPHLRVLFANGLYDLATPFFAAEYTADHFLDEGQRDRIQLTWYPAGHMMYFHPPSLAQLRRDLLGFYETALRPSNPR